MNINEDGVMEKRREELEEEGFCEEELLLL
jgi:hypothetical protein